MPSQLPPLDAEETVISWLNSGILPVGWSAMGDKPQTLPDQYVLVDRTGGPREAMVLDRAEILIEVYSNQGRKAAKDVALSIADQIPNLVYLSDNLTGATVNSVVNLDDLIAQYSRYQVYCDINCRR